MRAVTSRVLAALLLVSTAALVDANAEEAKSWFHSPPSLVSEGPASGVLAPDSARYVTRTWTEAEGLPNNSVWALAPDQNGGLWVGTLDGLAHFDGHAFETFDAATTDGFAGNRIKALLQASDGTLWIGTGNGLSTYQDGTFRTIEDSPNVYDIGEGAAGTMWLGTESGLSLTGENGTEAIPLPDSLQEKTVTELTIVGPDSVWFKSHGHLFLYHEGTVTHPYSLARTEGDVQHVDSTPDGTLWVHAGSRLVSIKDGRLNLPNATAPHFTRIQRVQTSSEALWIASSNPGLLRRASSTVHRVNPEGSVPRHVRDLVRDESGQWWIGTYNGGLVRLRRPLFQQVTRDPAGRRPIHGVYASNDGALWASTFSDGLLRIADSTMTQWTAQDGIPANPSWTIAEDDAGTPWIGTNENLLRKQRQSFEIVNFAEGESGKTKTLYRDPAGTLWIPQTEHGLYRYRGGKLKRVLSSDQLSSLVLALHRTENGALWIGTRSRGVARYQQDSLRWYGPDDGLPYPAVRDIHETPDGTIWMTTYGGGVARYDDGRFTPVTPKDGLPDGSIHVIHEAPQGTFWMTSNSGVFRVDRRQLEAVADGRRDRVYVRHFDATDGMPVRECNGNFHPALAEDDDGHLWIPTMEGLTTVNAYDPRLSVPESMPVRVTGVRADGSPQPLDSLRFAPSTARIALDFSATSLRHGEDLSFRFRLDDGTWMPAGGRRTAEFTNLDAGTHRFEVEATLNGNTWYSLNEPLRLTIAPHFYETTWFRLLVLLGIFGLLGTAYLWRTQALRRRQEQLQRMVDERTAQLAEEKQKTEEQARRLETLDEQKNRFFANVSHELRTPLTILRGALQDATDGAFGEVPAPLQRQLEIMRSNVDRLRRLTDQLLDLSRLETTGPELNEKPKDLVALLRQTVRSFVPLAERRGLHLELDSAVETHPCRVDPEKLEKVIGNLLSNALQNTPEGGKVLVDLDVEKGDPPETVVQVTDTGRGIDPERQEEIFERFAHAERENVDRKGTGIGLSLVREYVDLHDGTIALDSTPGEGTTFTVRLPLPPADPSDTEPTDETTDDPAVRVRPDAPTPPSGDGVPGDDRPTLLVVEDNADVRAYLRRHLDDTYHLVEATSGAQGLEKAHEVDPDLLLTDLMMPEMDGIELCQEIRSDENLARTPVVLLTARAAEEDAVAGLEAGADAYVTKPFSMAELQARLRRLLEAHWAGDAPSPGYLAPDVEVTSADEDFLARVTDTIEDHLSHSNFTVDDLAAEVGLSSRQLQRKLKRLTDTSPAAFIRQYRLDVAAKLLEENAGTVSEVAYEVGFGTLKTFSRRFKERFGCPPSDYIDGVQVGCN